MRSLPADRQTLAMAQAPVTSEVHQTLDVHRDFAAQVALHHVVTIDHFTNLEHLGIGELRDPPLGRKVHLIHNVMGDLGPNAMDILERDHNALIRGKIDARDTSHGCSLLLLIGRPKGAEFLSSQKGITQSVTRHPSPPPWGPASCQTSECAAY